MAKKFLIRFSLSICLFSAASSYGFIAGSNTPDGMEKCYGISGAGRNDGGGSSGDVAMPGSSKIDCDRLAFRYVPKNTCKQIIIGFTEGDANNPPQPIYGSLTFRALGMDPIPCRPYNPYIDPSN